MIYQILGWPRSRTAWLANFLSYGEHSYCFHEGIARVDQKRLRTVSEYYALLRLYSKKYKYVGDANTVALAKQKYIIPGARIVVIERDIDEVLKSLERKGLWADIPDLIEYPYNDYITIPFDKINQNLEKIWTFCLPTIPYPKERAVTLVRLNVQVNKIEEYLGYNLGV